MEANFWIDLIRRLPAPLHDALAFSLASGGEIVGQSILRLENDFMVLRGRVAGTQDQGRVIVLPFSHIVFLAFNRKLSDPEVQAIFGNAPLPVEMPRVEGEGEPTSPADGSDEEVRDEFAERVLEGKETNLPESGVGKAPPVSKTVLLARLRDRLAEQDKKSS